MSTQPIAGRSRLLGVSPAEEEAFTAFVRERGDRLLRYTRWLVPNAGDAEDVLQAALLRVAQRWSRHIEAPEAYALIVIRNLVTDRRRRAHLVAAPSSHEQVQEATHPDLADAFAAQSHLEPCWRHCRSGSGWPSSCGCSRN